MKKFKRKIHVIGLNSFKIEDLSLDVQKLFSRVNNIAAPKTYIHEIKNWVSKKRKTRTVYK